ncbi:MAG TPA: hypothetical protein PKA02_03860 [Candidatus Saccharibacteria bacterium]|nr:hypothetical protein [Candidatus Saccharibacteria bacterium]
MSEGAVAFVFSIGVGAWVYSKFQRRTGNQTQKSLTAAAVVGVFAFIVFFSLAKMFLPS